ncbi:calpain-13-like isoform X2 [Dendropsophus ebraccatus]|uniref:calpain-13-like isoform X2 n=1 Tax=Dendropsophus ebraccatus TaxID=150705 RepID=UPI003831DDAA
MPIPGVYQKVAEGQQAQRKIGTVESPKKFKGQDFNSIRDLCISRKQLFEDDMFPANLYSIGQNLLSQDKLLSIKWKRPTELQRDARFMVDGASIFDIMQGEIGDCWVLSVVGSLTLHRKFLENVVPKDQEFTHKYAGIFHFRFWQYGEWVDVVVDDRLPMLNGSYLSVQPRVSNEFWPSLLEKAYAKLRGSYQNLHWGFISEAMVDFTGGVQMDFNLTKPPPDLRDIVLAAVRSRSLMGCTTPGDLHTGNAELQNGLIQGHAYTVTDGTQIEYSNRSEDIVRVWNPWGKGEWNGRWSDESSQWDRVRPEIRKKLNVDRNDGEFWMSCPDFMQNFTQVNICNHAPSYLDFGNPQYTWETTSYYNQWVRGSSAGGCNSADDMWKNPQYVIIVPESQGAKRGYNVTVALMQSLSNERKYNPRWLPIGFAFCKVSTKGVKNGGQQKFSRQHATDTINSGLEQAREVTRSFMAPPGTYVVLPFTQNKGQESEFLLRIFMKTSQIAENPDTEATSNETNQELYSDTSSHKKVQRNGNQGPYPNDATLSDFGSKININAQNPKAVLRRYQDGNYENVFARYADQNSEMYAEHLQMLLNDVVITDKTFVANRGEFSLDSCRGILMLMDLNANGRLSLDEFGRLWKRLNMCKMPKVLYSSRHEHSREGGRWRSGCNQTNVFADFRFVRSGYVTQDLFQIIDVNQTGFLDRHGLARAVQEAGLLVSEAVLNIMLLRYANYAQKLSFADFVCCMIRLETVTKVFKNLTKDGAGVYLSAEEWMQIIMSS